jgi:MoxR-like ATPase
LIIRRREQNDAFDLHPVIDAAGLLEMRIAVEDVYVDPDIEQYIVDLILATRSHRQVVVGASPRGSLALVKLSRAWAAIQGRSFVLPDDIKRFF